MDFVTPKVVIEGEEAPGCSAKETSKSEEMCSREGTGREPTISDIQSKKEKRKRKFQVINEILGSSEDKDEEDEPLAKRHSTDEEDSSDDDSCDSAFEELKESIFHEMRYKENKLVILRFAEKQKMKCFKKMTVAMLKKQLSRLRKMYKILDDVF